MHCLPPPIVRCVGILYHCRPFDWFSLPHPCGPQLSLYNLRLNGSNSYESNSSISDVCEDLVLEVRELVFALELLQFHWYFQSGPEAFASEDPSSWFASGKAVGVGGLPDRSEPHLPLEKLRGRVTVQQVLQEAQAGLYHLFLEGECEHHQSLVARYLLGGICDHEECPLM